MRALMWGCTGHEPAELYDADKSGSLPKMQVGYTTTTKLWLTHVIDWVHKLYLLACVWILGRALQRTLGKAGHISKQAFYSPVSIQLLHETVLQNKSRWQEQQDKGKYTLVRKGTNLDGEDVSQSALLKNLAVSKVQGDNAQHHNKASSPQKSKRREAQKVPINTHVCKLQSIIIGCQGNKGGDSNPASAACSIL